MATSQWNVQLENDHFNKLQEEDRRVEEALLPGGPSPCTAFCCLCLRGSKGCDWLKAEAPFPLNGREQERESLAYQTARSTANVQ